jgi:hypothetical protein
MTAARLTRTLIASCQERLLSNAIDVCLQRIDLMTRLLHSAIHDRVLVFGRLGFLFRHFATRK